MAMGPYRHHRLGPGGRAWQGLLRLHEWHACSVARPLASSSLRARGVIELFQELVKFFDADAFAGGEIVEVFDWRVVLSFRLGGHLGVALLIFGGEVVHGDPSFSAAVGDDRIDVVAVVWREVYKSEDTCTIKHRAMRYL